jgi:hypothetical protein
MAREEGKWGGGCITGAALRGGIVELRALDDDQVGGGVYTPGQSGGSNQHLDVPRHVQSFYSRAVALAQTRVVKPYAKL